MTTKCMHACLTTRIFSASKVWMLFLVAALTTGCDSDTAGSQVADPAAVLGAPPPKSKKALRAEKYAGVTDPKKLVEGWQEELIETGYFKPDEEGKLVARQFAYEYSWAFDGPNAEFTIVQINDKDGKPLPGVDVLHEFVAVELQAFWGETEVPRFIRSIDGETGDQVIANLQELINAEALRRAEEANDQASVAALSRDDPKAVQSEAYNVLVKSGAKFETETVRGEIFAFRGTAQFHEDGRVEAHLFVTGLGAEAAPDESPEAP